MKKQYKPKQYSHIDYEALITYVMKNRISVTEAIKRLGLEISRITVERNLNNLEDSPIVILYRKKYIPKMQSNIPKEIAQEIQDLPDKKVEIKPSLEDRYKKLLIMKEIVNQCGGNLTQAAKVISSGNTPLGNVTISRQGLTKNMNNYEKVEEEYKKQKETVNQQERE